MRFLTVLALVALTAGVAFGQATLPGAGSSAPASSSSTPAGASLSPLPYVDTSNVQVQWTTSVPIGIQSSSTNSPTFTRPTFAVQSSGSVTVDADQTSISCSIRVEQYLNKNSPAGSSASSATGSAGSSSMMSSMAGVAPVAPVDSTVIYPPIGTSGGTTDSGYTQAQINALVASVQNSLSTQANDLIGYLKSSSMSSYVSKVSTDSVNLSPIYKTNQNNGNSVLTGYSGVYRVSFRVSIASNQTSTILSALPDHSVTSIDSVSFTASDDTFNRAQQLAIESATQNALQQLQATINAVNQLTSSGSATPTMSIASIEITNVSSQNTVSGSVSGYGEGYQSAASPTASAAYAPLPITGGTTQASATVKVTVFL